MPGRAWLHVALAAVVIVTVAGALADSKGAGAQSYPARPITMVVPFPAGGPSDTIGRIIADRMQASLGKPVIVENVAGASGNLGVGRVARAPGDGYTLSLGTFSTHSINGAVFDLTYDVVRDFEPVVLLPTMPLLIVTRKTMPADDLKGLVAWLNANPDRASAATAGIGASSHLAGVYFQRETATRFQFVPYRGVGLAMQDLIAGRIDLLIDLAANSIPQVQAGTVKAFAVTAPRRSAALPGVPTTDEAGLAKFHISSWNALFAPKATARDIVLRLNTAAVEAMNDAAVRKRLAELGQDIPAPDQLTPEALRSLQKAEIEKWWPMIRDAGIKAE